MPLRIAALVALAGALGYAAVQKAGINPNDWNACLLAIGLVIAIYGALSSNSGMLKFDRVIAICMITLLGLAALQLIPLPAAVVHLVSPQRFELGVIAAKLTTGTPVSSLMLTAASYETAEYLLTLSGYALVILFIRHVTLRLRDAAWVAIWPLLIICGLEAALGCYQAYAAMYADGVRGTYANRDHYAALLEMALPFALLYPIAVLQRDKRRHESAAGPSIKACMAIAVFVLLLTGILFSLSRMGFVVALTTVLLVLALVVSTRNRHDLAEVGIRPWPRRLFLGSFGIVIVVGFFYLQTDALVARFALSGGAGDVSTETRFQIWRDTIRLIKDYPLFGCGLGSYGSCFLRYKTVEPMFTVDYAHNDYLQVLSEFGVFGFAVGLIFVIALLIRTISGALSARSADNRCVSIACLGAIVAILLHSFVDFNMYVPANGLAFAWILGLAAAQGTERRGSNPQKLTDSSRLVLAVG